MKIEVREQVKMLLAQRNMKIKELSVELTKKMGKKYTPTSLSQKLLRASLTYNEMLCIAEILDFTINFSDNKN